MIDYSNPVHQAGLFIEWLKYGAGPAQVEIVGEDELGRQLGELIAKSGREEDVTAAQIIGAVCYYADSCAVSFNLSPLASRSVFMDGLMHGMALASGIVLDPALLAELDTMRNEDRKEGR